MEDEIIIKNYVNYNMKIASMSLLSWIYILKLMLQLIRQKK